MTRKKKIISAVAIMLAVLLSFIGGQTFSKYISQVEGNGIANIAKWSFKVNGEKSQISTINLTDTIDANKLVNGKIAPGTKGEFDIIIDSTDSEVGAQYKINFENEQNKPQNLKFLYEDKQYSSLKDIEEQLQGSIDANGENKIKAYTIYWDWPYETGTTAESILASDKQDTIDEQNIENYTFDVKVTGTQVTPV